MMRSRKFPLPFKSLRTFAGGKEGAFIVGAMFTAPYFEKAKRLAASCEKLGVPYEIHEVPTVHRSISNLGGDDLSYSKPNFIRHLLAAHGKAVLYVDADCEFVSQPELIVQLVTSGCDFAIYNWYADEYTDRFIPMEHNLLAGQPPIANRLYRFAGSVDWFTTKQLGCSGLVQFYGNSFAARALLSRWFETIAEFPGCADDAALTFAFNNLTWLSWLLKVRWLPKAYARIPYWIYAEPIINHPDPYFPGKSSGFIDIKDPKGRKVVYRSQMIRKNPALLFPRDCIIDADRRIVCKLVDGQLIPIAPVMHNLWL